MAFYQVHFPTHSARQDRLEAFARAHHLQVTRSFSDPGDERDIRLMLNLTRQGVRFMTVNIEKARPCPWPTGGH